MVVAVVVVVVQQWWLWVRAPPLCLCASLMFLEIVYIPLFGDSPVCVVNLTACYGLKYDVDFDF